MINRPLYFQRRDFSAVVCRLLTLVFLSFGLFAPLSWLRTVESLKDFVLMIGYTWEYFCTFTFSSEEYRNSKDLMYYGWSEFCKSLQKRNRDFKGLAVYELFQNGGFHMHAVLSDIDLRLMPARINNRESLDYGKFIYSQASGVQVFNTVDWTKGFNTVVPINPNSDNARIVNYLCKYMLKICLRTIKIKIFLQYRTGARDFFIRAIWAVGKYL